MSFNSENLKNLARTPTNWFWTGLDDWLFFLSGPKPPVFQCPPQFDRKRLIRLLVFAVTASGLLGFIITTVSFHGSDKWPTVISATSKPAIVIVLAAGTLAAVYTFFAKLFRVPISVTDTFYVFLFVSLPWIPSTALVLALGKVMDARLVFFLVIAWLTFTMAIILFYICLGIYRVTNCSAWRCFGSILLPIVLFIWLVIYLSDTITWPTTEGDAATPVNPAAIASPSGR